MLIWEKHSENNLYQVRTAGHSVRLYRNGIFHSQYNGSRIVNGGVWDMLWLPMFFRPRERVKRVLVLGVGAGAAIKKIYDYGSADSITGVDIDRTHLHIARKFVGLGAIKKPQLRLVRADAIEWLSAYRGQRFDMIIDDLFSDCDGEPVRAVPFLAPRQQWLKQLKKCLAPEGLLIANCVSRKEARSLLNSPAGFKHGCLCRKDSYDNIVAVVSQAVLNRRALRHHLALRTGSIPVANRCLEDIAFTTLQAY